MKEIVIAHRSWVFVGDVNVIGNDLVIENAFCIRRWGTTNGLGQLALSGPTAKTVLDKYGTVTIHILAVVGRINCNPDVKWP